MCELAALLVPFPPPPPDAPGGKGGVNLAVGRVVGVVAARVGAAVLRGLGLGRRKDASAGGGAGRRADRGAAAAAIVARGVVGGGVVLPFGGKGKGAGKRGGEAIWKNSVAAITHLQNRPQVVSLDTTEWEVGL